MPMASTTKIMTCILALEEGDPAETVSVSEAAASQPQVKLGMKSGQEFLLKDLLYSLMLESHNDSAVAVAEHVAGSVQGFADMMNRKAEEIGCDATYFITPNGLDAEDDNGIHHTTAEDLARIMKYCITDSVKKEDFLAITRTETYTFSDCDGTGSYTCNNHNTFLKMMEGALTGKTGFTADAGYCYVGALQRDGRTFIVSLLACGWPNNKGYKWADTKKLMTYGIDNFFYREISPKLPGDTIKVENGFSGGFRDGKVVYEEVTDSIADTGRKENGFYRLDVYDASLCSSLVLDYNGTAQYFSIANDNTYQFFREMSISPGIRSASHILKGLDGREVLEAVLSVKYYQNQVRNEEEV